MPRRIATRLDSRPYVPKNQPEGALRLQKQDALRCVGAWRNPHQS